MDPSNIFDIDVHVDNRFSRESLPSGHLLALPDDVLAQISVHACQTIRGSARWRREFYPLWLGKICRAWRECAWSASELWTTIILRVSFKRIDSQTKLLKEWLKRTKGRPLDIYIRERLPDSRSYNVDSSVGYIPRTQLMLQLLAQHSAQWRLIEFHLPWSRYGYICLPLYPTHDDHDAHSTSVTLQTAPLFFPLLQSASLHRMELDKRSNALNLDLKHAPALRTLSLSFFNMQPGIFSVYPTRQITHLILSGASQVTSQALFHQFPSLLNLTLTFCHVREVPNLHLISDDGRPESHGHLESLNVAFDAHPLDPMFNQLCLPTLKNLSVRVSRELRFTQILSAFVDRSACALTHLTLKYHITSELQLVEFLSSCHISSSLIQLHIYGHEEGVSAGVTQVFFDRLHPHKHPDYLPRLRFLKYEGRLNIDSIAFIEPLIIRSRIRGPDNESEASLSDEITNTTPRMAVLQKAIIVAGSQSNVKLDADSRLDPEYAMDILTIIQRRVLTFVNADGTGVWS